MVRIIDKVLGFRGVHANLRILRILRRQTDETARWHKKGPAVIDIAALLMIGLACLI